MALGLAEQQVDVVRHQDVAVEVKLMVLADSFEGLLEKSAGKVVVEVRKAVVAGERDEVIVAGGLVALEHAWAWGDDSAEEFGLVDFLIGEDARVAHSTSTFWLNEREARVLGVRFAWWCGLLWFPLTPQVRGREWGHPGCVG